MFWADEYFYDWIFRYWKKNSQEIVPVIFFFCHNIISLHMLVIEFHKIKDLIQ